MRITAVAVMCSLLAGVAFGETTVTINGKTIRASGQSITISNSAVIVNGQALPGSRIAGSGSYKSERRDLDDFADLHLDVSANVTVQHGEKASCIITADDNILPLILTECKGTVLRISSEESYSATQKISIELETPRLTSAKINGSGEVDITSVTQDTLALVINGSGDITARGSVAELKATINGSGDVHADGLEAERVIITVNGSGDADVNVSDALTANIHGSGDIAYAGSPTEVHTSVHGSGEVAKK